MWKSSLLKAFAVAGLVLLSSCDRARKQQERKEALRELEESKQAVTDSLEMTEDGLRVDHDVLDKHAQSLRGAADKVGGKQGEAIRVVADMSDELNKLGKRCEEMVPAFVAVIDFKTLSANRDFEARRKVLAEYEEVNRQILESYESFGTRLEKSLDDIGFKGEERRSFQRGALSQHGKLLPLVREIRGADVECINVARRVLDQLERVGTGWKWGEESEQVEFDEDAEIDIFNGEMAAFQKQAEIQTAAQTKLIGVMNQ